MKNDDAIKDFLELRKEFQAVGDKKFHRKRTIALFAIPHLIALFLFIFSPFLAIVFILALWATWYGLAIESALFKTHVEPGEWAYLAWFKRPIRWFSSGYGLVFVLWPFKLIKMKHILLPISWVLPDILTAPEETACYDSEEEKEKYSKDMLNKYSVPITISGTIQVYPFSIKFFERLISPSHWEAVNKTKEKEIENKEEREKTVEAFLEEEIAKQVLPQITSDLSEIAGTKTVAQIRGGLASLRKTLEERITSVLAGWGLKLGAPFQINRPLLNAELLYAMNKNVIAVYAKETKMLDGEGQRRWLAQKGRGWAEAFEVMKKKAGPAGEKMFSLANFFETLGTGYETMGKSFEKAKFVTMEGGDRGDATSSALIRTMAAMSAISPVFSDIAKDFSGGGNGGDGGSQ